MHNVTNEPLYLIVGAPMLLNAVPIGLLVAYSSARFEGINERFAPVCHRFDAIDKRFDDMRDLWRAEFHRVEEVVDARFRHLEEHR